MRYFSRILGLVALLAAAGIHAQQFSLPFPQTTITSPTNNQCLVYQSSSKTWVNGSCASGGGATVTGSPVNGNLTFFSGAGTISNGNLSGDCSTSGTGVLTCTTTHLAVALPVNQGGTGSVLESEQGEPASSYSVTCDGVTDQTTNIQAALTYGYAHKIAVRFPENQTCVFGSGNVGLTIYAGQTVLWNNAILLPSSSLTSGCAVTITGDNTSRISSAIPQFVHRLRLYGPQWVPSTGGFNYANTSSVDGLCVLGPTTYQLSELTVDQAEIAGFRNNIVVKGPNVYLLAFNDVRVAAGWQSNYFFNIGNNAGERIVLNGGVCSNAINPTNSSSPGSDQYQSTCLVIVNGGTCVTTGTPCNASYTNSNVDIYANNWSCDYNDHCVVLNGGNFSCYACHLEDNTANDTVDLVYVAAAEYPSFRMYGGFMGGGPGGADGSNGEPGGGRVAFIKSNGAGGHFRTGLYDTQLSMKSGSFIFFATDSILGELELQPLLKGKFSTGQAPKVSNLSTAIYNRNGDTATGSSFYLFPGWTIAGAALGPVQPEAGTNLIAGVASATGTWSQVTSPKPNDASHSMQVVCGSSCNDTLTQNIPNFKSGGAEMIRAYFNVSSYTSGTIAENLKSYAADGTLISTQTVNSLTSATSASLGDEYFIPVGTAILQIEFKATSFVGTAQMSTVDAWRLQ